MVLPITFLAWGAVGFNQVKPLTGIIKAIIVYLIFLTCVGIATLAVAFILTAVQA